MKALTIRQPWATLIALGVKTIETRSWRAPVSLIANEVVRLDRALDAMNDAVLLTFRSGSSAPGMEFIADWLSNRDACSEAVIAELGDTPFPPDPERQVEA